MHDKPNNLVAAELDIQRQFWNKWIADCLGGDSLDPASLRRGETVLALLKSLTLPQPTILEIGCATAWLSTKLAEYGPVTAPDLADKPITAAQSRCPHINFIQGDFLRLTLPSEHFDVVVSVDVNAYVPDQRAFVNKVYSVLKSGGYAILICPHKYIRDRTNFVPRSHSDIPLNCLNMGPFRDLLRQRCSVLQSATIIPGGNRGYLRWINSRRLNAMVGVIVPDSWLIRVKEQESAGKQY
jgi:SAM-dependent methyltransferase